MDASIPPPNAAEPDDHDVELGEGTPLLVTPTDKPLPDVANEGKNSELLVSAVGALTFLASIAAMVVEDHPFMFVSGVLGAGAGPYAIVQQQKITQANLLVETNKRVREEVLQLTGENERLAARIQDLNQSVTNLRNSKDKLDKIQKVQGANIDELERQLEENKKIFQKMSENLEGEILQNLFSVVLACDHDGDMNLSDEEIDHMVVRLEGVHGVDLDENLIREKIVEKGRSLDAIMDVARNLLKHGDGQGGSIFKF